MQYIAWRNFLLPLLMCVQHGYEQTASSVPVMTAERSQTNK
jgi:hypothetical protein